MAIPCQENQGASDWRITFGMVSIRKNCKHSWNSAGCLETREILKNDGPSRLQALIIQRTSLHTRKIRWGVRPGPAIRIYGRKRTIGSGDLRSVFEAIRLSPAALLGSFPKAVHRWIVEFLESTGEFELA